MVDVGAVHKILQFLHFGLPDGAELTYELTVTYPSMNGIRRTIVTQVRPADISNRMLVIAVAAEEFGVNGCNNTVSLPIRLLDFKAKQEGEGTLIQWITAIEENNSYFTLERSQDGQNFTEIARVEGAGNSLQLTDYQYLDSSPSQGINYYRLRQTDFDGTETISNVVAVSFDVAGVFEVYPNPSHGEFYIKTHTADKTALINIYNHKGVLLKQISNTTEENIVLEIKENLSPGLYLIEFQHKQVVRSKK